MPDSADKVCRKCEGTGVIACTVGQPSDGYMSCDCKPSIPLPAQEQGGPYSMEPTGRTDGSVRYCGPGVGPVERLALIDLNRAYAQGQATQAARVKELEERWDKLKAWGDDVERFTNFRLFATRFKKKMTELEAKS